MISDNSVVEYIQFTLFITFRRKPYIVITSWLQLIIVIDKESETIMIMKTAYMGRRVYSMLN